MAEKHKYRYVVRVTETVESQTAIESERKLTYAEVEDIAEKRRIEGKLSLNGVTEVYIRLFDAFKDGKPEKSPFRDA